LKKLTIILLCLFLCGCTKTEGAMDAGLALRSDLLSASGCTLDATVTADYGNKTYTFAMGCEFDAHGNLSFAVKEPKTIAGITGQINNEGGNLTFDGNVLAFPLLADGHASPISAPWLLFRSLEGGYLRSYTQEDRLLHITVDDSYEEDAMTLEIWLNASNQPVRAEILYKNRRILTVTIENFQIL
jgi:hypothetical protein